MAEPCKRPTLDFAPVGLEQIPGHRQSARPRPPCSAPGMAPASAMQTLCSPTAETIAAPRCGPVPCRRLGLFAILNLKTRYGGTYHLYAALGHFSPKMRIFIGELTCQPAAQAVKSQAGKKRVIPLRCITGKSPVPRPNTHRTTADMAAIGGRAKKKLRRPRPMERQQLKGQGFLGWTAPIRLI